MKLFPLSLSFITSATAFTFPSYDKILTTSSLHMSNQQKIESLDRKQFLKSAAVVSSLLVPSSSRADEGGRPDQLDIENFLRTGTEAFPMGVSSQAGKSKPVTGVFLRDGTDVERNAKTGAVLAEIVLGDRSDLSAILVSFSSGWPLAKGTVFDVECRDAKTGDSAFLSVTEKTGGKSIEDIPTTFFVEQLFAPTARFSFYGPPTDFKLKKSEIDGNKRIIEFSFSQLSQSTNAEIPRRAIMVATKPENTDQAVMLVASSTAQRYKKVTEKDIRQTISSFNASPSPKSALKVRRKENFSEIL